jgi:ribosome maturation factor RimP
MIKESSIRQLADEFLRDSDRFIVDVLVKPGNRIHIFLDSDTFVSIDHCAALNRYIESNLDREVEDFELSVSSAGLDQPLKLVRQYKKQLNHEISITLKDGRKITGTLQAVNEKGIEVMQVVKIKKEITETRLTLDFSEIKETKQVIKF